MRKSKWPPTIGRHSPVGPHTAFDWVPLGLHNAATGTRLPRHHHPRPAAAADINDALIYRYFPDKQAILAALIDEAIAVFQELPKQPDQAPLPLDQLLELIGIAFVHTAQANLDLVTIVIGERHALIGDTRFVEFIDAAATRLGHLIYAATSSHGHGQGYLTARAYFGSLIAFVLLQDQLGLSSVRPVDTAEYIHHLAQLTARGSGMA